MPFKKTILFLSIIVFLFLSGCQAHKQFVDLTLNHQLIKAELASTSAQQARGLSYRDHLPIDHGMLFVFKRYFKPSFWMKGMRFPLDIIWLDNDIIVDITPNIPPPQPNQPLERYTPKQPVNYVLELNAGSVSNYGLKVGDHIKGLPLP